MRLAVGARFTVVAAALLAATAAAMPAAAQKSGGTLRMPMITSPASMSIHEESTIAALGPMMGVFNNLVMFDPAREAGQSEIDCPRSSDRLELERGRH